MQAQDGETAALLVARYTATNAHSRDSSTAPEELREAIRQQPFEPFRVVLADGVGYDIRHPDLMIGHAQCDGRPCRDYSTLPMF